MKNSKKDKKINKKALMTAIAFSIGTISSAYATIPQNIDKDTLFKINEVSSQSTLIAHEGEGNCGEGKCGEGKCGEGKAAEENCGGIMKWFKSLFGGKKETTVKAKATDEAKCGEEKCGEGSCG